MFFRVLFILCFSLATGLQAQSLPVITALTNENCSTTRLQWSASTWKGKTLVGYTALRSTGWAAPVGVTNTAPDTTACAGPLAVAGVSNAFWVVAQYNDNKNTAVTSVWAAVVAPVCVPNVPSQLAASPTSCAAVVITWRDNSTNETGFRLERSLSSTFSTATIISLGANVTSYTDSSVTGSTTYYYRVSATNAAGSAVSSPISVTTPACPPLPPTSFAGSALSCSEVLLTWNATVASGGAGLAGFNVYRDGDFIQRVQTGGVVDAQVLESEHHSYYVTTVDTLGQESPPSATIQVTTPAASPARISKLEKTADLAIVHWTGSPGALYQVQRASSFLGPWTNVDAPTTNHSLTSLADEPSSNYRVAVATRTPSYTANATANRADKSAPTAPSNVSATASSCTNVNLSWIGSIDTGTRKGNTTYTSGLAGYLIYRNNVFLKQVDAFITWTSDATVNGATAYSYSVAAIDRAGNTSARSLVASVTTPPCVVTPPCTYTIAVGASPSGGGSVGGGGVVNCGASVTVSASASAGYSFVNWTEGGNVVSTSASYTFLANGNRSLTANFTLIPCTYSIAIVASPAGGGTVLGGGTVNCGSSVTVWALPNTGYSFVNWTEGGNVVSTSASYTFTANSSRTLTANFTLISCTVAIGTSWSPLGSGLTGGGGIVNCGSSVTVQAFPNTGYNFVNWTEGGNVVSTSADYTFVANVNRSLVANFASAACTYTISAGASPLVGGVVSGGGTVNCGSSVTVQAFPNTGYNFVNWTEGGNVVSTSASYTFTANGNRSLTANFAQVTYTITTGSSPSAGGVTTGGGTAVAGSSVTVSAWPNAGYSFVNWTEGGNMVSTSASYTFAANGNRSLVANFSQVTYTIAVSSTPTVGGGVAGGGIYASGSSVTVSASANAGYSFVNWTEGGNVVSSSAVYTFTANGSRNLVANFGAAPCAYSISPPSASFSSAVGSSQFTVTTGSGCSWTSATTNSWITIIGGWSGTGGGTVHFTVATNAGISQRTGAIIVSGQQTNLMFTVTQAGGSAWTKGFGGTGNDIGAGVANDSAGNILLAANFSGMASFGGADLTSAGSRDIVLAKHTPDGAHLWSRRYGGAGEEYVRAMAVGPEGNIYICGGFVGTGNFGGDSFVSAGEQDMFIAAYGAQGNHLWSKAFAGDYSGASYGDSFWAITVDAGGDVWLSGTGSGKINFGGDDLNPWLASGNQLFLVRFSAAGQHLWSAHIPGANSTFAYGLAIDNQGNVLVGGGFRTWIEFGGNRLTAGGGFEDLFIAKLVPVPGQPTQPPTVAWARAYGADKVERVTALAVDGNNDVIVAGTFNMRADLGAGQVTGLAADQDLFVAKYSGANGNLVWAKPIFGTHGGWVNAVRCDSQNRIHAMGYIYGTYNFGDGFSIASINNGYDGFYVTYSGAGVCQRAQRLGGTGADIGQALSLHGNRVVLTGLFNGSAQFGDATLTSQGGSDAFLMRIQP